MKTTVTLVVFDFSFICKRLILLLFIAFFVIDNVCAQYNKRVYANTQSGQVVAKGDVELLGAVNLSLAEALQQLGIDLADLGSVTNPENAVDVPNGPQTYATLSATYLTSNINLLGLPIATVKVGALVTQNLSFPAVQNGTSPVFVKIGYGGGLAQSVVDGLSLQATLNGNPVGPVFNKTNSVVGLLGNLSVVEAVFSPGVPYDGVRVSVSSEDQAASLNAFYSVRVYHAYVNSNVATLADCDAPFDVLHQAGAAVGVLGSVQNPFNAIDGDLNSFATLNSGANVISAPGDGVSLTAIFPSYSKVGDSVKAVLSYPGTLLEVQLLNSIVLQAIDNQNGVETVVGQASGSSLLGLQLLPGNSNRATVSFKVGQPFNRVRISYGGVVTALQSVQVYDIKRVATKPVVTAPGIDPATGNLVVCEGAVPTLTITAPEAGSSYLWFTQATGGSPLTAGVGTNGTSFTPANLALGLNEYFVALVRPGCGNEASARTRIGITVNPSPKAADIVVAGNQNPYCAGATVSLVPSVVANPSIAIINPVFRWYRNADKTGEILSGTADGAVAYTITAGTLNINGLAANRTYYVGVTPGAGGCESAASELKAVPVGVNPIATDATITNSASLSQCAGQPFVFVPTAPDVNNPVFAYYLDANKTQVLSNGYTDGPVSYAVATNGTLTVNGLPSGATKIVYVTVAGSNYCENLQAKAITFNSSSALATPTFVANQVAVCGQNGTAIFTVSNHVAGISYQVFDAAVGGNLVTTNVTVQDNTITFGAISAGATYYIQAMGTGGCMAPSRGQLTINFLPRAVSTALNPLSVNGQADGNICADENNRYVLTATATGVTQPVYYLYQGNNLLQSNSTGVFDLGALPAGVLVSYSVGVSANGFCETAAGDRKSISFTPTARPGNPVLNLVGTKVITLGDAIQLSVEPVPADASSFQWRKDGVLLAETSGTLTIASAGAGDVGVYTVAALNAAGCTSVATATVTLKFSDLTIWKSYSANTGQAKVRGGEEVTYTIRVRNNSGTIKNGYTMSDAVPAYTTLVGINDGGTQLGGVVSWSNVQIPANTTVSRSFTVRVNDNLTGVAEISNVAYLDNGIDPQQASIPPNATDATQPGDATKIGTLIPVEPITSTVTWKSYFLPNSQTAVKGGEEINYTIYVRNTGNQNVDALVVKDNLPAHTTFVSVADGGVQNGQLLTWSGRPLVVGETLALNFVVKVDQDLTGVGIIRNVAVSNDGSNPDQNSVPPNATDPTQPGDQTQVGTDIPVTPLTDFTAQLSVASNNANGTANAGDVLTYTLVVANTGNQALTSFTVNLPIPSKTDFLSAANGGVLVGSNVVYNLPNLLPGQSTTVTAQVTVQNDLTGVTAITNMATVASATLTKPSNQAVIGVGQRIDFNTSLTVSSSNANGKANAGDVLTYTFTVNNVGEQVLSGASILDPLPAHTTFLNADNGGGLSGSNILFDLADIAPGQSKTVTAQVQVDADLTGVATITNLASFTSNQGDKPMGPAVIDVLQNTDFATALAVSSSNANGKANAGDVLTYTFQVTNTGNQALVSATITDPLPANTTFLSATDNGSFNGSAIIFNLGNLQPGEGVSVSAQVRVAQDLTGVSQISNTGTASAGALQKPIGPAVIDVVTNASFVTSLTVSSSNANGKANADDILTYVLSVVNTGDQTSTAIRVNDPLPAGTEFVDASNGGVLSNNDVVINLADLAPAATAVATIRVRVKKDLSGLSAITNTANVATAQGSQPAGPATIDVAVLNDFTAGLTVSSSNSNGKANAGDILTYVFEIKNMGNQVLSQLKIADPIPEGTNFVSASNGGALVAGEVIINLQDLAPGETAQATVKAKVKDILTGISVISNTGLVSSAQGNKNAGPANIEVVAVNDFTATLAVATSNANGLANAGDILTYTLTVSNVGNQELTAVKVSTAVPQHTSFEEASHNGGLAGNMVMFDLSDIAVGQTVSLTLKVKVQQDLSGVTAITNSATVSTAVISKTAGPVSIAVGQNTDLSAVLSVVSNNSNGKANPGDILTYTLQLTNQGSQKLSNVAVSDPLPANTMFVEAQGNVVGDRMLFSLGDMNPGQQKSVVVKVKVNMELRGVTEIGNQADISADQYSGKSNLATLEVASPNNDIYVPNVFTPNGDGKNDFFGVFGNAIASLELNVYNQWGQRIYQATDINKGWDGTFRGQAQPSGVYVYYIKAKFFDGQNAMKKGTITLLR